MDKTGLAAIALIVGAIVGVAAAAGLGIGTKTTTVTQTAYQTKTVVKTVTTTVTPSMQELMRAKLQEELKTECTACHPVPQGVEPVPPEERKTVEYSGTVLMANDKLAVLKTDDGKIIHVARAPMLCSLKPGDKISGQGTEIMVKPSAGWMLVKADTCNKQS